MGWANKTLIHTLASTFQEARIRKIARSGCHNVEIVLASLNNGSDWAE
jgi:hypothetical protein